jgi:hypothetical protein
MQSPPTSTEDNEASVTTENEIDDPNLNRTVTMRRKAAKRTLPFDLVAEELLLVPSLSLSPQAEASLQAEGIPVARKKPRIEEPLPITTDEAAKKAASPDVSVGLPPPAADNHDADAVTDSQPNAAATRTTGRWTKDEDAELTRAIMNNSRMKLGNEIKIDWAAVAALVHSRTKKQCWTRWNEVLDRSIQRTNDRTGKWTADEEIKLKDAVLTHGSKNWGAIAALVRDRTKKQCRNRWRSVLDPNIDRESERTGKWSEDEDSKLKDAVQVHGSKNWAAIAALVPDRTKKQCGHRWHSILNPSIDRENGRTGKWVEDEDSKLNDAVQLHGGKNWAAIAALVPGRTIKQCSNRWKDALYSSLDRANERRGKWTEDEDVKLKDSIQTHGDKDWVAIAALVPGRRKKQCYYRWKDTLDPSIDRKRGRKSE